MSLEAAIQENTAAVRELIAALAKGQPIAASTVAAVTAGQGANAATDKPKAEAKTDAKKSAAAAASSQPGAKPQSEGQKDGAQGQDGEGAEAVTYEQVKAKLLQLSKEKGRDPVVALLSRFGVQKGPDLQEDQWADFIKKADGIMAGTYDPEVSETADELA